MLSLILAVTAWIGRDQLLMTDAEIRVALQLGEPLQVLAADGQLIGEFGTERRRILRPDQLRQAFLAAEDARFYQHPGVDPMALLRAGLAALRQGSFTQGGSTISMQVARNFMLTPERSLTRKVREILLALRLEALLSKDEILALYLNKIYLGKQAYGIAAAAERYYGKPVDRLDLAEAAMLAGLPRAPSALNPATDPLRARERRDYVLGRMLYEGLIDVEAADQARATPVQVQLHEQSLPLQAQYAAELVRQALFERLGPRIYSSGYRVFTTIDPALQQAAVAALRTSLLDYDRRTSGRRGLQAERWRAAGKPALQGALLAISPQDGAVQALVGGYDFDQSPFNRAVDAWRQPGSAFKPVVYAAALDWGFTPETELLDLPISVALDGGRSWHPANFDHASLGPIPMREALAGSRNQASVDLFTRIGLAQVRGMAMDLGFSTDRLPEVPSLALGSATVTAAQMASAYSTFANAGRRATPYLITRIEDGEGQPMSLRALRLSERNGLAFARRATTPVLSRYRAADMNVMLREVIRSGTARRALQLGRQDLAGKTGTTNDTRDTWFCGYHPQLLAVAWMGFDDMRPLAPGESTGTTALALWIRFMEEVLEGLPESDPSLLEHPFTVEVGPPTQSLFEVWEPVLSETDAETTTPGATQTSLIRLPEVEQPASSLMLDWTQRTPLTGIISTSQDPPTATATSRGGLLQDSP